MNILKLSYNFIVTKRNSNFLMEELSNVSVQWIHPPHNLVFVKSHSYAMVPVSCAWKAVYADFILYGNILFLIGYN